MARIVYMDESGVTKKDEVMVVVGIMVDADKQAHILEEEIRNVVKPHVRPENLDGYVVHAAHLNGNKNQPEELRDNKLARDAILDGMAALPAKLGFYIIASTIWWDRFSENQPGMEAHQQRVAMQATGIALISSAVDGLMHKRFAEECAWIIAENNHEVKEAALHHHREMKSSQAAYYAQMVGSFKGPFSKLRDGISFANKPDSPALQIADVCAWAIRRYYAVRDDRSKRFYDPLEKNIVIHTGSDLDATKKFPDRTVSLSLDLGIPRNPSW
ncbi:DUF3800 domain-containing protein [Agrobacterium rhizogenes]|nr:DUF3800 domain-containing protein [Rhizobium rhizogenes]NTG56182.1 DUF3800 domain-containing protein [Rhizobium rhizogenes]NTH01854.1 DUF3800 domain-containing protein [Rhizobium rhizogenes]NTI57565.1 DUF3800 domain-containing protein [Rhizobium rhizogenes]